MLQFLQKHKVRTRIIRFVLSLLDIPSIDELDAKDQKQIDDWLKLSAGHRGFHLYTKARDRAFVEAIMKLPIETEANRRNYYEFMGARQENARLYHRAAALSNKQ